VKPLGPPPRRQPHRALVAGLALGVTAVLVAALAGVVTLLFVQQRHAVAADDRDQKFVDTASQTVINMFSYTQDNIDDSVNQFVNGISGPLRDMMSQGNNVENLKAIFRDTNASSEAVINGAALEKVDDTADNASVLVSVRVTVTNLDGVNSPSKPYRLRVIVHEDDNGRMTGYDLKYPDGGN
jgi:Mce-associated membrane protein